MMAGPTTVARQSFLLQRVQPAMTGLIDGSLSTLAPIFAVAFTTSPHLMRSSPDWRQRSGPAPVWRSRRDSATPEI
jgi:hypothetical protein